MTPHGSSSNAAPLLHPAAAAWRRFSADTAEIEQLDVLAESKKTSVYRLVRRGGAPVIAKRYAADDGAMFEQAVYEQILSPAGVPRLVFYGALRDEADGSWSLMEDAGGVQLQLDDEGHRRGVASWLGELHAKAAPLVARPARVDHGATHRARLIFAREALARLPGDAAHSPAGAPAFAVRVLDSVHGVWDTIERALSAGPVTLVHGDVGRKNVRVRRGRAGREVVAYDWEMAVVGSPAADLWWLGQWPDLRAAQDYRRAAAALWGNIPANQLLSFARVGFTLRRIDCIYWCLGNLEWEMSSVMRWSRDLDDAIRLLQVDELPVWSAGQ